MAENLRDFLTQEPLAGELLSERMALGPLSAEEALRCAIEMGSALHQVHKSGLVHGGLSPFCVVLTAEGARLVPPTASPGDRAAYRSPEEVRREPTDSRSDIFAFGAILYELASGHRAFSGTGAALADSILSTSPAPLMAKSPIYAAMEGAIAGCLEKDPMRRRQRIQNAVIELKLAGRSMARTAEVSIRRPRRQAPAAAAAPVIEREAKPAPPAAPVPEPEPRPAPKAAPRITPRPLARPAPKPIPSPAAKAAAPRAQTITAARPQVSIYGAPAATWTYSRFLQRRVLLIGGAVLALAATSVAAALYLNHKPTGPVLKFSVTQPENTSFPGMPSVSPDGRYLTFSAVGQEGKRMLWLRPLDALHATMIPGTEGASAPFWSPDSQVIAFFAGRNLKKVKISGGASPETICPAEASPGGGAWNKDGTILFSPSLSDAFYKVSSNGGKPEQVLKLDASKFEQADLWPQFLPDNKHFVFYLRTDLVESSGVYVGSLDSPNYQRLFASQTNAVYSAERPDSKTGYLLYINERNLMSQQFNATTMELIESPTVLANEIGALRSLALAPISVSRNNVLVYQGVGKPLQQIVWMDRNGRQISTVGEPSIYGPPRISPNGDRAALARVSGDGKVAHLWLVDVNGGSTQLTDGTAHEGAPNWSPDGARVVYFAKEGDVYDLYQRAVTPNAKAELLYKSNVTKYPTDWSHDGKYIMFYQNGEGTKLDLWGYSTTEKRASPILDTVFMEGFATLSPDGKWMAYQSDQGGHNDVYVQPFDGLTSGTKKRWQVSNGGGLPHWRRDSSELFYMTPDGRVMAVSIRDNNGGLVAGTPQKLFQTRPLPKSWNLYDVAPDGERFIVNIPLEWTSAAPITVITNWTEKLKE